MPRVSNQKTIERPASYAGIGLHTGNRVTMTFLPAEPNTGIRFRRVDLDGQPEVEASIDLVNDTQRSTVLGKGNIRINTVEHVLATFSGYGIHNAIVELDSIEPPIADGSARAYCKMIETAGITTQAEKREPYKLTDPIEINQGGTNISVFPYDGLRITCTSANDDGRHTEYFDLEVTPETWKKELSEARTFCFFEELEYLIRKGLIKGGSLANAVIIRDDAVLTTEPLRYKEEFVRHKMLDILGDLTLLGRPFHGHIKAFRPSHAANCEMTRKISEQMLRPKVAAQTFVPPVSPINAADDNDKVANAEADTPLLTVQQIQQILPHRYPFLMLDRVNSIEGNKLIATKNVTINELYFQGHFPKDPIMPGVMQLEAMAQASGLLMLKKLANEGKIAYFMAADKVKWRKPVRPGDVLIIEVDLVRCRGKLGKAKGVCKVGNVVVSEAEVSFVLMGS
jgi:UDP-3-O-[3-hydroxymyristoyl] N-acetylglucosamine deacetylase / 3-hydroxyacyl-[acyl-carrier-protein] dehydratase